MKIINKEQDWSLKCDCDNCGTRCEINNEDICYDHIRRYFCQNLKVFGYKCPSCNTFNEIPDNYIPKIILKTAKHISLIQYDKNIFEHINEQENISSINDEECVLKHIQVV